MKKQLFLLLATTIVATTFAGCSCTGSKTATDTTTESTVESTTPTKNENATEPEQPTTTVADIETDSNTESNTTEQESTVEELTTEAPTEEPTEKPTEAPTQKPSSELTEQQIKDAYKLTPNGSYTTIEVEVDPGLVSMFGDFRVVRRLYENGAIRDYCIISGVESMLDQPYGIVSDDYVADTSGGYVPKPTQPQKTETVFKGLIPPRSNYSSDQEWLNAAYEAIGELGGAYSGDDFSSEADVKLFNQLHRGSDLFIGDIMSDEEWSKWCEENGFTVN